MWDVHEWMRGAIRHMRLIGQHPEFKALQERNEARLAEMKRAGRLTENHVSTKEVTSK